MALYGYVRVSTDGQDVEAQVAALRRYGVEDGNIYRDVISGKTTSRDGLDALLGRMERGDCLVVWKLDRLGRSLQHLIATVEGLEARGIGFSSMSENIDTTTAGGKLVFHIFGALAEFERKMIGERTRLALAHKRDQGVVLGRPKVHDDSEVLRLHNAGKTYREIRERTGVSLATISRAVKGARQHG